MGDITPYCGVSKEEKKLREMNAMREIAKVIAPRGEYLLELFEVSLFVDVRLINVDSDALMDKIRSIIATVGKSMSSYLRSKRETATEDGQYH